MKRIAILACRNANDVCAGCGCLNAFYDRKKAFERYGNEPLRLTAFMRCSHCISEIDPSSDPDFLEKLDRLVYEKTDRVHVGICARKKDGEICKGIQSMVECIKDRGIEVVFGTH